MGDMSLPMPSFVTIKDFLRVNTRTHITTADLEGTCQDQQELFERTFKGKAKITSRNLEKAIAVGLDVFWLERLIPESAWAEYDKVTASARAEYDKVSGKALIIALTGGAA